MEKSSEDMKRLAGKLPSAQLGTEPGWVPATLAFVPADIWAAAKALFHQRFRVPRRRSSSAVHSREQLHRRPRIRWQAELHLCGLHCRPRRQPELAVDLAGVAVAPQHSLQLLRL